HRRRCRSRLKFTFCSPGMLGLIAVVLIGMAGIAVTMSIGSRLVAEVTGRNEAEVNLVRILKVLHHHEGARTGERQRKTDNQPDALSQLGTANTPSHRQAAEEQHDGVQRSQCLIEKMVTCDENLRMI